MNDEFYNADKWRRKAKRIMRRDKYLCRDCARYGRVTPAEVVHHIIPLELRPDLAYDNGNLISLCDACHNKRHPERGAVKKRRRYYV